MTAAKLSLVILAEMVSLFVGTALAAFFAVLFGVPQLLLILAIPSLVIAATIAGRWIRRRAEPPRATEIKVGSLLYVSASTFIGALSSGHVGAIGALVATCTISFTLYRSAKSPAGAKTSTVMESH